MVPSPLGWTWHLLSGQGRTQWPVLSFSEPTGQPRSQESQLRAPRAPLRWGEARGWPAFLPPALPLRDWGTLGGGGELLA